MLTITRIDHLGQVVPDIEKQAALLTGLFGFVEKDRWENKDDSARGITFDVPGRSGIQWQVAQPLGDSSPLQAFLDTPRGPGVRHITMEVSDLEATAEALREAGIEPERDDNERVEARIAPNRDPESLLFRFVPGSGAATGGLVRAEEGTLGIVALDHLCHAYRDRDELARFLEKTLGMQEIFRTPDGEHEDLADLVMEVPGKQMFWEVIQPVGDESFIQRFLDTRGPSPHHVTFEVADWQKAVEACERHEVPMFDDNSGVTDGARWNDAFVHPKLTGGMLVQLFWEEKPGVWVRSDKIPSGNR